MTTSKISPTNFITADARGKTNIPYAKEIAEALNAKSVVNKILINIQRNIPYPTTVEAIFKSPAYFESRWLGMTKVIDLMINNGHNFFVEIACGFSSHNLNVADKYPMVIFVASDLPMVINEKERIDHLISKRSLSDKLFFKPINILSYKSLKYGVNGIKDGGSVVFLAEGLLRYLSREQQKITLTNIEKILSIRGGYFATPDFLAAIKTKKMSQKNGEIIKAFSQEVGTDLKANGFDNEDEAKKFIQDCGFKTETIKQINELNELSSPPPVDETKETLDAEIWILSPQHQKTDHI